MKMRQGDAVWCVIMFDLPVQTAGQRKEATKFRKMLLDSGYAMIQFSVYGKYSPTLKSNLAVEQFLKAHLPASGEVRIFHLTDAQWSAATRLVSGKKQTNESAPEQLVLL